MKNSHTQTEQNTGSQVAQKHQFQTSDLRVIFFVPKYGCRPTIHYQVDLSGAPGQAYLVGLPDTEWLAQD